MPDREKVINGLSKCGRVHRSLEDCAECPYKLKPGHYAGLECWCRLCDDALELLKEQEARVLEYSEIEKHPLVWLADKGKKDVIPALFLQYNGWSAEFSRQAQDKNVDTIVRSAKVVADERTYGITWIAWTSRPTPEQMRDTKWEGENETM